MLFFKNKKKKYVSCDLIEHGLDFSINAITLCCRIPLTEKGFIKLVDNYNGEILDYKELFKIKNKFRKEMQEGKILPECKGCVYLKEQEWDSENYISFMNFNNWRNCNEHCIYCGLNDEGFEKRPQYNVYPFIKDMADKGYLRPGGHITIAGGEPSFAPEFDDLVELLLDKNFDCIRILSNGTKYSKVIERGLKEGHLGIVVSVDSGSREMFQKIKRFDFYDIVWENLKKYASVQFKDDLVKTKYIIIPDVNDNEEEINLWINKTVETGIKSVALDIEMYWYDENKDNLPEKLFDIFNYTIEKLKEKNLNIEYLDRAKLLLRTMNSI